MTKEKMQEIIDELQEKIRKEMDQSSPDNQLISYWRALIDSYEDALKASKEDLKESLASLKKSKRYWKKEDPNYAFFNIDSKIRLLEGLLKG